MIRTMLALALAASALGAGTALAAAPQSDAIFAAGTPGNPVENGCSTSSLLISTDPTQNSTDPADWGYRAAAAADTNGNGLVCAIPLPDADRDAHYAPAQFPFLQGIAFYLFRDDNATQQTQP